MLRIESHIENLLLNHDCVILPGIGGFITRYEEAFICAQTNEIFPPYRSVSFNSQLTANDGLLTQSYMMAYDTNYPKALSLVDEDVRELRELLQQHGELTIGTIGTLQLTQQKALLFSPADESGFYSRELYGLTQCMIQDNSATAQQQITQSAQQKASIIPAPVIKESSTTTTQAPANSMPYETKDNTHYVIRISKSAVRYTAATIAAALLYFIFTIAPSVNPIVSTSVQEAAIISNTHDTQQSHNTIAKTTTTSINTAPSAQHGISATSSTNAAKPDLQPNNKVATIAATNQTPQTPETTVPDSEQGYTIVLASAVTLRGANILTQEMTTKGFAHAHVMQHGKMIRVIYSSYPSESEAYSALRTLRTQSNHFSTAWVMKK